MAEFEFIREMLRDREKAGPTDVLPDLYAAIAARIHNVAIGDVTPDQRSRAKEITYRYAWGAPLTQPNGKALVR